MSRIGRSIITIPAGVTVEVHGEDIQVKGPKGELTVGLPVGFSLKQEDAQLSVVQEQENRETNARYGLLRTLIANAVTGVHTGFEKKLEMNGVGFRVEKKGEGLVFSLGFSHKVDFVPQPGIALSAEGNIITVSGIDKQLVGQTAAQIRELKKPEPYKGKGIRYIDERVRRKAGKAAAKGA
jgi:large subunit ribosomal protein L6